MLCYHRKHTLDQPAQLVEGKILAGSKEYMICCLVASGVPAVLELVAARHGDRWQHALVKEAVNLLLFKKMLAGHARLLGKLLEAHGLYVV